MRSVRKTCLVALCASATLAGAAFAQTASVSQSLGVSAYPAKGQSESKQQKDEQDCLQWAQKQTGVNPYAQAQAPAEAPQEKGGAARGAGKGALVGVGVGALTGNAGRGAAIGAGTGAAVGGTRQHRQNQAAQEQAEAQNAQAQASTNALAKSFSACLKGRGYSVE